MRLFWSVRSIPELADLPERQREKLWRRGYRASLARRPTQIALVFAIGLAAAGYVSALPWATATGAVAGALLLFQVAVAQARPFWREERERLDRAGSRPQTDGAPTRAGKPDERD